MLLLLLLIKQYSMPYTTANREEQVILADCLPTW